MKKFITFLGIVLTITTIVAISFYLLDHDPVVRTMAKNYFFGLMYFGVCCMFIVVPTINFTKPDWISPRLIGFAGSTFGIGVMINIILSSYWI